MYSVLIPVYNERGIISKNITTLIEYLESINLPFEIVVCSNGSNDGTNEIGGILEKKHRKNLKFITDEKRGVGIAFKKLVRNASYDKLVCIDMDLTTDLEFIPKCIKLLDEFDMVIGSKRMGEQERQIHRIIVSKGYLWLVRILLGLNFGDYSIGAKGYRKQAITSYLQGIDDGSSYVVELAYILNQKSNISEMPVFCQDDRESKFNLFHEIFYRFRNLLSFWLKKNKYKT